LENRTNTAQRFSLDFEVVRSVRGMTKIAILSVIAYVIMFFETPIFFFPPFLQMDFSDLPALLGGLAMGPAAGILIQLMKNLLHFVTKSATGGAGELANFIVGVALILPATIAYKRKRTKKTAIMGMAVGVVLMAVVAGIANYFVLIPFYARFMPIDQIIAMSNAVNSVIVDKFTLVLYGVLPFNLLKGFIVMLLTALLYKKLSPILKVK